MISRLTAILSLTDFHNKAFYPESGGGYIRLFYIPDEFSVKSTGDEELLIEFLTSVGDGLLWYNMDGDIRSFVYLQVAGSIQVTDCTLFTRHTISCLTDESPHKYYPATCIYPFNSSFMF